MKKIITIIAVTLLFVSCGAAYQLTEIAPEDLEHSKTIENLNQTKNQLYSKSNKWTIKSFISADDVISFQDKEEGEISGKFLIYGELSYYSGISIDKRVFALINIRLKDNRANINIKLPKGTKVAGFQLTEIKSKIEALFLDFETFISNNKKDDW